jgi:YVTN family beta-propeller protein
MRRSNPPCCLPWVPRGCAPRRRAATAKPQIAGAAAWVLVAAAGLLAARGVGARPAELLVLEKQDGQLAIADPARQVVVARVPAGDDPHEIVVDTAGARAYVSNYGAFRTPLHQLSVVDLDARRPLPPVELGPLLAPHGLALAQGKVYFTAEGSKAVGRYDPVSRRVDWVLGVGHDRTHMLSVASDATAVYTTNVNSDSITIITPSREADVSGWAQVDVPVGQGPEGFDVRPGGAELWAANSHDGTVSVVDLGSRRVTARIDLHTSRSNRLKFTPDGGRALVSDLATGELVVIDAAARREIGRLSVGRGAAGILIEPSGTRAFVAASSDAAVAIVDLASLSVVGRIATGKGPDGLAWVPAR